MNIKKYTYHTHNRSLEAKITMPNQKFFYCGVCTSQVKTSKSVCWVSVCLRHRFQSYQTSPLKLGSVNIENEFIKTNQHLQEKKQISNVTWE